MGGKVKKLDFSLLRQMFGRVGPLLQKYKAVLIVLLAGVLLLASGGWFGGGKTVKPSSTAQNTADGFDLTSFEADLTDKLASIDGVGRVSLMLSLDETEESVYAVNVRQSTSGDNSKSYESDLTVLSDGSYGEAPVTVKSLLPTFRGAVILCDGADNAAVKYAVTQAVSTVCGVGSDKVTVLKMAAGS